MKARYTEAEKDIIARKAVQGKSVSEAVREVRPALTKGSSNVVSHKLLSDINFKEKIRQEQLALHQDYDAKKYFSQIDFIATDTNSDDLRTKLKANNDMLAHLGHIPSKKIDKKQVNISLTGDDLTALREHLGTAQAI